MSFRALPMALLCCLVCLISCQKEISLDDSNGNNNNNNNTNNNNPACNNTVMKMKKWAATFDAEHYIESTWNSDGTIKTVKINVPFSEYRTASYNYENGRIKEAVLHNNLDNEVYDTAIFHYDGNGKVDSMYLKNDSYFSFKLNYANGKLVKFIRYADSQMMYYWDIETDAKDNLVKAVEWWPGTSGLEKESTYTFSRDDRKNPFAGLAPYLFYLDNDYPIFRFWGPNNYVDQRYIDHTGSGVDLTTGYKFKYNSNCYPASTQMTIQGGVLFTTDDFIYTYY